MSREDVLSFKLTLRLSVQLAVMKTWCLCMKLSRASVIEAIRDGRVKAVADRESR